MRSTLVRAGRTGDGAVTPVDTAAMLVIVQTPQPVRRGQVIPLKEAKTLVGRGRKVGCLLDDPQVDDFHAVLNCERHQDGTAFWVYPVSEKGLAVNGCWVREGTRLHSGDRIRVGGTELVFFQAELKGAAS
jgi:predicted component of type VI protein secretion system